MCGAESNKTFKKVRLDDKTAFISDCDKYGLKILKFINNHQNEIFIKLNYANAE